MKTSYFTLGSNHQHTVTDGDTERRLTNSVVIKITAEDPRARIFELFGPKWSMEYNEPPEMEYYSAGIYELGDHVTVDTRAADSNALMEKEYLGDGAYVKFDGFHVVVTAEDGTRATDTVALDPKALESFLKYLERLDAGKAAFDAKHNVKIVH